MSDTITVNVTQEDIDKGMPCMPSCCPITLAVKREHGFKFVSTGVSYVSTSNDEETPDWTDYYLPSEAQEFIDLFDGEGKHTVEPFTFTAQVRKPRA